MPFRPAYLGVLIGSALGFVMFCLMGADLIDASLVALVSCFLGLTYILFYSALDFLEKKLWKA